MATVEKQTERLLKASEWGDVAAVRALLESGDVDLNGANKNGWTPLNKASARGYLPIVELLLAAGADPHAATTDGWTPLHAASSNCHLPIVELLLAAGADPNVANEDELTPLHWASFKGHVEIVQWLVKAGADPYVATKNTGETPLHYACKFAECSAVRALLALGADLHAEDNEGRKPLHFCIRPERYHFVGIKKPLETLQFLVSIGATWDAKCDELVSTGEARQEAPALRVCMALWSQEVADGFPLTNIPLEIIKRGADSTQVFVDDRKSSMNQ